MNAFSCRVSFIHRYPFVALTLVVGAAVLLLHLAGLSEAARWSGSIYVALFIVYTAVAMTRDLLRGHFGLDILALVAMIATLAVGEYVAALIVVLMLSGGEALEDAAAHRAKRDLDALLSHNAQSAHVLDGGRLDATPREVPVDEVKVGDVLLVKPSEVVPADGTLLSAEAAFDESSLTGEPLPVGKSTGQTVLSGSVNGAGALALRVLRPASESQFASIVTLVRQAQDSKAPVVRLADRFAVPFTLLSLAIAAAAWLISGDPARFAQVLVLATPCPLLIAAPVAFLGGLSRASRAGVVVKGGGVLEQLGRLRSAAFDKTGTLTQGRPRVVEVRPEPWIDADELLALTASAEQYSTHALAEGIVAAAREGGHVLRPAAGATEHATDGVSAVVGGRPVLVGKPAFVSAAVGVVSRPELSSGHACAYVAVDGRFAGTVVLADPLRPEAPEVVAWLRAQGVQDLAIFTGDVAPTARAVAAGVSIDRVEAELLPADKVRLVAELRPSPALMVGDGVNDAPVLAAADVGVAMGAKGATAAGEAADAVILRDSLLPLTDAVAIGRHTLRVATTAIWLGIALSVALMLVASTGAIPAVAGALTQELIDLAAILYALRALRPPSTGLAASTASPVAAAGGVGAAADAAPRLQS